MAISIYVSDTRIYFRGQKHFEAGLRKKDTFMFSTVYQSDLVTYKDMHNRDTSISHHFKERRGNSV